MIKPSRVSSLPLPLELWWETFHGQAYDIGSDSPPCHLSMPPFVEAAVE